MSDQNFNARMEFREKLSTERERQFDKWGAQIHTSPEWIAILTEEVGEAAKACCNQWIQGEPVEQMLKELVQVAAVAEAAYCDLYEEKK